MSSNVLCANNNHNHLTVHSAVDILSAVDVDDKYYVLTFWKNTFITCLFHIVGILLVNCLLMVNVE